MTERQPASGGDDSTAPGLAPRGRAVGDAAIDVAIVQRMALGEDAALGALYDRWADSVHALVSRIVRDDAEAEEVVEAVFWQAWQQASRYAGDRGSPAAWLLSMARSRALDRLRTLRRRREEQPVDDAVFAAAPAVDDPLAELDAADRARHVAAALAELPAEQRQVLELAYFDGLSQTEISAQLDVPLGTIKTRARLALRKLRDHLQLLRGEPA
jgi:RNA polymerase sigma-70 factor, ECF subfamily